MMHASMIQPSSAPAAGSADDRATEFKAVDGTGEQFNGYTLMVEAYAAIWLIMLVWLAFIWRKQQNLAARVEGLEGAIARAERKVATKAKPQAAAAEETTA
jgi:hypothetical protein